MNLNELQLVLNEKKVVISLISETHLIKTSLLKIFGYDFIRADHPDGTAHGGAALLVSNKMYYHHLPPYLSSNIQADSISIKINSLTIFISSCYFLSGRPFPSAELSIPSQILSFTHNIGADFNEKYQTWSRHTNTTGRAIQNFITLNHLKILGSLFPIYWPSHKSRHPDYLDLFITNLPNHFLSKISNLNDPASDHTPVLLLIEAQPSLKQSRPTITQGIINWNIFKATILHKIILNTRLKSSSDVHQTIAILSDDIKKSAKDSSTQNPPYQQTPYLSPELHQLIAEKRKARSKWQQTLYPADKINYNYLSNKLKPLLKKHIQNLSFKNESLWRKTKSILRFYTPPLRSPDDSLATTDREKADTLAEKLSGVFKPHSYLHQHLICRQ